MSCQSIGTKEASLDATCIIASDLVLHSSKSMLDQMWCSLSLLFRAANHLDRFRKLVHSRVRRFFHSFWASSLSLPFIRRKPFLGGALGLLLVSSSVSEDSGEL